MMLRFKQRQQIKKMMLMQQQVFKHQVEELHRLYNRQKKLMYQFQNSELQYVEPQLASEARHKYSLGYIAATNDDPKEPNKCFSGLPIEFDLERPAESNNFTRSSIHQNEYITDQEGGNNVEELELRLSIGTTAVGSKHCSSSSTKLLGIGEFGSCRTKGKTGAAYGDTHLICRDSDVRLSRKHTTGGTCHRLQDGNLNRRLR